MLLPLLLSVVLGLGHSQTDVSGPDAANNLSVSFFEDTRPGFRQHAVFDFSWTPPPNDDLLTEYELVIEHVPPDNRQHCKSDQNTLTLSLPPGSTNLTVRSINGSTGSLPLYTCNYIATLVSIPGGRNVSTDIIQVIYKRSNVPELELDCEALYNVEEVLYNITVAWDFTHLHPLVIEALLAHPITVGATEQEVPAPVVVKQSYLDSIMPQETSTEVTVFTVRPNFKVKPERNEVFFWRRPILPGKATCKLLAYPKAPTQIPTDSIRIDNIDTSSGVITFHLHWEPPVYPNGGIESYDLCISEDALDDTDECEVSSADVVNDPDILSMEVFSKSIESQLIPGASESAVQIRAVNEFKVKGNWSEAVYINITNSPMPTAPTSSSIDVPAWAYAVIALVLLATVAVPLVVVAVFIYRRYCFHRHIKTDDGLFHSLNGMPQFRHIQGLTPVADEWELKRGDIELKRNKPLGQGAFGEVFKGILQPKAMHKATRHKSVSDRRFSVNCVVAVKMLKDDSVSSEKANFLKEIEMMKNVSGGENSLRQFVVNMVGCVTTQEPMLLILEFVSHGDLQSYLRSIRKKFTDAYFTTQGEDPAAPYMEPSGAYSELTPKDEDYEQLGLITERNLVDFARQIAAGMEYLSSLNIVHRDLACRNVLVGDGKALKVSDFGMSRLLPPDEVYVPTSHGPLPLRWMAIEALFYRHFTTKTDIWSYGVVLWEICTMGGFPYPTMSNRDLPELLRSGYRMDKPETCSEEVYEVMLNCWSLEAEERPSFPELHKTFDSFLTTHTQDNYPYMEVLSKPYHLDNAEPTENPDTDPTPVNLDIEITDVDGDAETRTRVGTHLARSVSHYQPRHLGIVQSESHFSLRSYGSDIHSSIQDIKAELQRQTSWRSEGGTDGQEFVETRYVVSPTTTKHSNN